MTSIGRLTQRCSKGAGGVKKSILDHKEEIEDATSVQRWHICRRIVGLEWITRYSKTLTSNSGGKRETDEDWLFDDAEGSERVMIFQREALVASCGCNMSESSSPSALQRVATQSTVRILNLG